MLASSGAQINIEERLAMQAHHADKARRQKLTDLEQNHAEELRGIARKKKCGLCLLEYSNVNLVLTVPYKAVVDIRTTWIEAYGVREPQARPPLVVVVGDCGSLPESRSRVSACVWFATVLLHARPVGGTP